MYLADSAQLPAVTASGLVCLLACLSSQDAVSLVRTRAGLWHMRTVSESTLALGHQGHNFLWTQGPWLQEEGLFCLKPPTAPMKLICKVVALLNHSPKDYLPCMPVSPWGIEKMRTSCLFLLTVLVYFVLL
jgi:hypothetical protein